jgi:hypothetical protein
MQRACCLPLPPCCLPLPPCCLGISEHAVNHHTQWHIFVKQRGRKRELAGAGTKVDENSMH